MCYSFSLFTLFIELTPFVNTQQVFYGSKNPLHSIHFTACTNKATTAFEQIFHTRRRRHEWAQCVYDPLDKPTTMTMDFNAMQ